VHRPPLPLSYRLTWFLCDLWPHRASRFSVSSDGTITGAVIGCVLFVFVVISIKKAVFMVREKENIVIERLGRFQVRLSR
jgi:hypothetical protein